MDLCCTYTKSPFWQTNMGLTWIDKALVGKIARMFVQAIAEPILSSIQPMGENIQVVPRSGFNFRMPISLPGKEW
jgi:hypothetical protein